MPGPDGNIRVVKVKTTFRDFIRPLKKLCPHGISCKDDIVNKMLDLNNYRIKNGD